MGLKRDLTAFDDDNARWRAQNKRVPWDERLHLVRQQFPGAMEIDFNIVLRDNDVFARVLKDILKVDQIEPGRAGPRPNLDYDRGMQTWREMTGQDFSELPFHEAFQLLSRGDSFTAIARKTLISRSRAYKLWHGLIGPTVEDLRTVAAAYGKKPAFFAEYRAEYILAAIAARLSRETEMTIPLYLKLVRA
jgi:transcriptional regulator with XRE-family HTH domain